MVYFLIMPVWLLAELVLAALWLSSRHDEDRALWNLYLRWILIGSSVGFVAANLVYATSASWATEELEDAHLKMLVGAWLLIGPILCSAAGFTGGTLAGLLRAGREARRSEWFDHAA